MLHKTSSWVESAAGAVARAVCDIALTVRRRQARPSSLTPSQWDGLLTDTVLPCIAAGYSRVMPRKRTTLLWHASENDAAELASVLQNLDPQAIYDFMDRMIERGASLQALFQEIVEPTARWLGRLHDDDVLNDLDVAVRLSRLQCEIHRWSILFSSDLSQFFRKQQHSILVAPQPGEPYSLGAAMASEYFFAQGWNVSVVFPDDDRALCDTLRERWYDVLDLSQCMVLARCGRWPALKATIASVRSESLNPALIVLVRGNSLAKSPRAYEKVGADCVCASIVDTEEWAVRRLRAVSAMPKTVPEHPEAAHAN